MLPGGPWAQGANPEHLHLPEAPRLPQALPSDTTLDGFDFYAIDWEAALADWDGELIAPYMWSRRLEYMWYYGWDCASGGTWNL